jgi:hypothetical protein
MWGFLFLEHTTFDLKNSASDVRIVWDQWRLSGWGACFTIVLLSDIIVEITPRDWVAEYMAWDSPVSLPRA